MNKIPKNKDPVSDDCTKQENSNLQKVRKSQSVQGEGGRIIKTSDEIINDLEKELYERSLECAMLRQQLGYTDEFMGLPNLRDFEGEGDSGIIDQLFRANGALNEQYSELKLKYESLVKKYESLVEICAQKNQGSKKNSDSKSQLEEVMLRKKEEFELGAEDRLLNRAHELDKKLKEIFLLKLGIFILGAGIIGYAGYENLPIIQKVLQETLKSVDINTIQGVVEANFVNLVSMLNYEYRELVDLLKSANRSDYILLVLRGLGICAMGGIALKLMIDLISNLSGLIKKAYEWWGVINVLMILGLIIYYSGSLNNFK